MISNITEVVARCTTCQKNKGLTCNPRASLQPIEVRTEFSDWHVDFVGTFPQSSNGNKYTVIFVDRCTKWVEALAFFEKTASQAARHFVNNVVTRFGVPKSIHSDQRRQFESIFFQQVCELLGIQKTHSTAYHPDGNGLVERYIRTLKMRMSMLVQDRNGEWDQILDLALMSILTTVNESPNSNLSRWYTEGNPS
ncbi:Pol polyprotein [Thelohanellus kitauei]|uniref:Pol polyprotein n=1 Tax=Thelohanellus kitauei TaxID=669202 RepID=A0A0C2MF62_THEKT|nr:Pol polyprotein [Thelohanellus kitauei]